MNQHLIRTEGIFPPGGYYFQDPITGKKYDDTHTTFSLRVQEIIRDRKANARLFTDQKRVDATYVERELSEQICQRLNGNPRFCTDGTLNQPKSPILAKMEAVASRQCPSCGSSDVKAIACSTCSSLKITGYQCNACGLKTSL
jgi:predicted RNA-binding Zn-ribbon protein involved in translation (DUF1610 family)